MTATQNPTNQQPKTASDAGARPYATVNPYTGETEKEFPFLEAGEIDGVDRARPRRVPASGAAARSRSARRSSAAPPS